MNFSNQAFHKTLVFIILNLSVKSVSSFRPGAFPSRSFDVNKYKYFDSSMKMSSDDVSDDPYISTKLFVELGKNCFSFTNNIWVGGKLNLYKYIDYFSQSNFAGFGNDAHGQSSTKAAGKLFVSESPQRKHLFSFQYFSCRDSLWTNVLL